MKYLKIFAFLLGVVLMTACSNDDEKTSYNDAPGVVVSMGQDLIRFRESSGMVKVPVTVTGESNGYVTVVCEVKEYTEDPEGETAMDDVHYLLTSKVLTIAPGETEGYFEIKTVDDYEINPSRYFTITLVDAQGATLGDPRTTVVELRDNDKEPYDRLAGTWYIKCKDWSGGDQTLSFKLEPYEDGTLGYNHAYLMTGLFDPESKIDISFKYSEATETGSLTLKVARQGIYPYEDGEAELCGVEDGYLATGTLIFEWTEDFNTLNLVSHPDGFNLIAYYDGWVLGSAMNLTSFVRNP